MSVYIRQCVLYVYRKLRKSEKVVGHAEQIIILIMFHQDKILAVVQTCSVSCT